ncbi:MAG: NYN domain-containing protein [Acidobacteriota bacterium]
MSGVEYVRSALFVDFDNIFLGFDRQQTEAAVLFGTHPEKWVRWLEHGAPIGDEDGGPVRRLLVRRCYINPRSFHEYRPYFIRSGFEVVDCPPLTSQGKTSADIMMAIDMLDALAHSTRFDEFIVLSGDADFTPVLLRLRKHDRRTAVLAVGPASPAYKSSSDTLIDESVFLEKGLGIGRAPSTRGAEVSGQKRSILRRIAGQLEEVASMTGRVEAVELLRVYKSFAEFSSGENWLGFFSLRRMTEAVVAEASCLQIVDEDPWWVSVDPTKGPPPGDVTQSGLPTQRGIRKVVLEVVKASETPVVLAAVAQGVTQSFGDAVRRSGWLGAGSFKALVERLDLGGLEVSGVIPGYIFDPVRHDPPDADRAEKMRGAGAAPPAIVGKISSFTEMPHLSSQLYAEVLSEIAKEVNENGYHLTETSKAVRDRCAGKGIQVARSHVSFILKGIVFAGHTFGETTEEPGVLGAVLVNNVLDLCGRAQMPLDDDAIGEVQRWILGAVPPASD